MEWSTVGLMWTNDDWNSTEWHWCEVEKSNCGAMEWSWNSTEWNGVTCITVQWGTRCFTELCNLMRECNIV